MSLCTLQKILLNAISQLRARIEITCAAAKRWRKRAAF
jgi:hypothetical protein